MAEGKPTSSSSKRYFVFMALFAYW